MREGKCAREGERARARASESERGRQTGEIVKLGHDARQNVADAREHLHTHTHTNTNTPEHRVRVSGFGFRVRGFRVEDSGLGARAIGI